PYLPEVLRHRGVPLDFIVSDMYLTTTGIFGVPLGVSTDFVFLFVLFGALLDRAGGGKYFIDVAFSALGTFRGGPAKAAVLASGLTGLVSGSSIANTVTTGTFTIPLMKKVGFPAYKAAAVEVAASTNGQLMPPVMGAAAFIMAEIIGIPYLDVVRAAFLPAIISYLALFWVVHVESMKMGIKAIPRAQLPPFFKTLLRGCHFII
ncbi:TRAP transporter large permease subunit, partial [Desulfoprunum benzoelyticum]|uniref:TRAP transporter permease n=1 Tax=Desulfoprunum benzoelyticum TaxID=1506996 RepID=UPI00196241C1|nr:TRAP transporter large permease subunit [Desulfoprunum benzoelyticum]